MCLHPFWRPVGPLVVYGLHSHGRFPVGNLQHQAGRQSWNPDSCRKRKANHVCTSLFANKSGRTWIQTPSPPASEEFSTWGLIKICLQGVMHSVTIRLGLNPSAKDRRWSSRNKLLFFCRERFRVGFLEACLCAYI